MKITCNPTMWGSLLRRGYISSQPSAAGICIFSENEITSHRLFVTVFIRNKMINYGRNTENTKNRDSRKPNGNHGLPSPEGLSRDLFHNRLITCFKKSQQLAWARPCRQTCLCHSSAGVRPRSLMRMRRALTAASPAVGQLDCFPLLTETSSPGLVEVLTTLYQVGSSCPTPGPSNTGAPLPPPSLRIHPEDLW